MTEPVNNQWIDETIKKYYPYDMGYMDIGGFRQAILSKLESIEQEAKVDVWQEVDNLALGYRSYRMSDVAQERLRQLKGKG